MAQCGMCGAELTGRQQKWCSLKCQWRGHESRRSEFDRDPQKRSASQCRREAKRRSRGDKKAAIWAELSPAEWVNLWHSQNEMCAVCCLPLRNRYDRESIGAVANLDHDHQKEKSVGVRGSIRGLLCRWCNKKVLPAVRDSAAIARRLGEYLGSPPAPRLLDLKSPRPGSNPDRCLEVEEDA